MTGCFHCHKLMAVDRSNRKSLHSIELSRTITNKPHKFVEGIFFFGFFPGFVCLFVGLFLLFVRHLFFVYLILLGTVFHFLLNNQHLLIYYQPLLGQILLSIRNIVYIVLIFDLFYSVVCGFFFFLFCFVCFVEDFLLYFSLFLFLCIVFVFVCFCFVFVFVFVFVCFLFIVLFILICIVLLSYSTLH